MRRQRAKAATADVDLTPMLDVVFILLIFFIVTAVFLEERALALEPPPPPAPPEKMTPEPAIIVEIAEDGLVRVNGRAALISSVRANLERLRAETPNSAVIIQAHPKALNGDIIRVRDQIASAHIDRVNLILSDV